MARIRQRIKNTVSWTEIMHLILAGALEYEEAERLRVLLADGHLRAKALQIIEGERGK